MCREAFGRGTWHLLPAYTRSLGEARLGVYSKQLQGQQTLLSSLSHSATRIFPSSLTHVDRPQLTRGSGSGLVEGRQQGQHARTAEVAEKREAGLPVVRAGPLHAGLRRACSQLKSASG